jgi:sodium transport system permease protein
MNIKGVGIVFNKEIKDLFRDRKTLIIGILIPLLIFPIMFGFMGKGMEKSEKQVTENLKIALVDNGNSSLGEFLKSQKSLNIIDSRDMKKDVQDGKIFVGLAIPEDFENSIKEEKTSEISIMYDDTNQSSEMARSIVASLINEVYSKEVVKARLNSRDIDVSILNPLTIKNEIVAKEKGGTGKLVLGMILPMMLVLYAMTGPMAAATDLGAGEKERGTLEPLLSTQTNRMSLLFGKLLAITVMGVIGSVASLIGVFLGFKAGGNMFGGDVALIIPINALIMIGVCTILLTMVFGALELSISIYARSFKEAQTYLSPLTIVGIVAGYGTYMMDVKNISIAVLNIPLVNIVIIIKELISGIYNPLHIGISFGWALIYIAASVLFARYMFSKEKVIFRT